MLGKADTLSYPCGSFSVPIPVFEQQPSPRNPFLNHVNLNPDFRRSLILVHSAQIASSKCQSGSGQRLPLQLIENLKKKCINYIFHEAQFHFCRHNVTDSQYKIVL